jgi:hypothetical protein
MLEYVALQTTAFGSTSYHHTKIRLSISSFHSIITYRGKPDDKQIAWPPYCCFTIYDDSCSTVVCLWKAHIVLYTRRYQTGWSRVLSGQTVVAQPPFNSNSVTQQYRFHVTWKPFPTHYNPPLVSLASQINLLNTTYANHFPFILPYYVMRMYRSVYFI